MTITADQRAELDQSRSATFATRRATVPALEEILFEPLPVLDHGFVRVIDYMGGGAGGPRLLRPRHQEGVGG
jgi:thymidylate synthase (FAD)